MSPPRRQTRARAPRTMPEPVLEATALYIGDNGRVHCGAVRCAGTSAGLTGIGLDGVPVVRVAEVHVKEWLSYGLGPIQCETCGRKHGDSTPA